MAGRWYHGGEGRGDDAGVGENEVSFRKKAGTGNIPGCRYRAAQLPWQRQLSENYSRSCKKKKTQTGEAQWWTNKYTDETFQITQLIVDCDDAPLTFVCNLRSAVAAEAGCSRAKERLYLYQLNLSRCINSPLCSHGPVQPFMLLTSFMQPIL